MIKVGDWVEVIRNGLFHNAGEKFAVVRIDESCVYCSNNNPIMTHKVRPLKTEAQTRNAKLGTGITFKPTGAKGVFWKSSNSTFGEEWSVLMAEGSILTTTPSQIRLDHEPEYKEIPFSEATHEQRMQKGCVNWLGHTVDEIVRFKNGTYAWSFMGNSAVMVQTDYLTVRIPA